MGLKRPAHRRALWGLRLRRSDYVRPTFGGLGEAVRGFAPLCPRSLYSLMPQGDTILISNGQWGRTREPVPFCSH